MKSFIEQLIGLTESLLFTKGEVNTVMLMQVTDCTRQTASRAINAYLLNNEGCMTYNRLEKRYKLESSARPVIFNWDEHENYLNSMLTVYRH